MAITREEALSELQRRQQLKAMTPEQPAIQENSQGISPQEAQAELARRKQEKEFSWPRFVAESAAKVPIGMAELAQMLSQTNPNAVMAMNYAEAPEAVGNLPMTPNIGEQIHKGAKNIGLDLQSQKPTTPLQRIAGHGIEFGTSALLPGSAAGKLAKLKNVGAATGAGLTSGGLQEMGVPGLGADILGILSQVGAGGGLNRIKDLFSGKKVAHLTEDELKVAKYLQENLGEENVGKVLNNLENPPQYPITQYEPMTAEIAGEESPLFAQLHRMRTGIVGSGIPEKSTIQSKALRGAFGKESAEKSTSHEIQNAVEQKLEKSTKHRFAETNPGYVEVGEMKGPIITKGTKDYMNGLTVRGDLEKDVNFVRDLLKPRATVSKADKLKIKQYEKDVAGIKRTKHPEAIKKKLIDELEMPNYPKLTIAEASAAKKAINAKLEGYVRNGKKSQARQLKEIKTHLEKDLEHVPLEAETTAKYRELSNPVNEIMEHKGLKNIPKNRKNSIMPELFDQSSADNFKQLKKVLKENPSEWKGVQDASIEYLEKSIRNARELSYPKLKGFLKKHGEALKEILTEDQMKFLNEVESGLNGRNIVERLGAAPGSPTMANLTNAMGLDTGIGTRILSGLTYLPSKIPFGKAIGESLRYRINRYGMNRKADVLSILDNVLKHPEEATKLLNHKFKSQTDFNKYMDNLKTLSVQQAGREKEGEE